MKLKMKTKIPLTPVFLVQIFLVMLTVSCVSSKKYESLKAEYDNYKNDCEISKSELKAIKSVMDEEQAQLQSLAKKINDAMQDLTNRGVNTEYKNGMLYVNMEDNLLYESGSAKLGEDGKKALAALASALNDYPKLKVVVVGHTDSVQFKSGSDNWTLSTERANGVVRSLRDDYSVDPARLTAAGRGKYDPVADNATAEGRAKNRRTEIILRADLERIWRQSLASRK